MHTQAGKEPAGSLAAPSTPGRALSAQLAPGTLTVPLQGQFWLGQSLGPMEKSGSCVPVTSCFLLLELEGSLGLPPGFCRNGNSSRLGGQAQHSHTQRNSWSEFEFTFDGGNEPVTHTASSCFIPSLPTLHLPAANKRKFISELFLSWFQLFVSVTQQIPLGKAAHSPHQPHSAP